MRKNKAEELDFLKMIESKIEDLSVVDDEKIRKPTDVVKTGSLSIDISTGIGGIPKGRFTEFFGSESGGKTTLALSVCNQAIKNGDRVLYIDAENTLDYDYIGTVVKNYTEELFNLLQPKTMEDALFIAEEGIRSGKFGLIILDSIGGMAPKKVMDDELTDANVALLSRIMTTFVQRNAYMIRENNTAFIGINQVRDKIGSYFGGFETPGGHAWKHILSLRIQLSRISDITKGDEIIGILSKFVVKKNKLAPPFRSFTVPIIFGEGVDTIRDIVEFSSNLGIIGKRGSYYVFDNETLDLGMAKTIEHLKQNPEKLDKIVTMCYTAINMNIIGEKDEQTNINRESI